MNVLCMSGSGSDELLSIVDREEVVRVVFIVCSIDNGTDNGTDNGASLCAHRSEIVFIVAQVSESVMSPGGRRII